MQMDNMQKMQFFKTLPQVLDRFPKVRHGEQPCNEPQLQRPLLQKVFPYLSSEFASAELIPFILPSVFYIAEQTTPAEFASVLLPPLIPVFAMQRPYQVGGLSP